MTITRYYSTDAWDESQKTRVLKLIESVYSKVSSLQIEKCYYVETTSPISQKDELLLRWLLKHPQHVDNLQSCTSLTSVNDNRSILIEIGPRFNFSTAFSTNCVNICQNVGLKQVKRIEASNRYLIEFAFLGGQVSEAVLIDVLSDRMTECVYTENNLPVERFDEYLPKSQDSWYHIPIMQEGRTALERVNKELGLAFGDWDLDYYTDLFKNTLHRNPTTVELFDCAQSNSEHSRHWFFRGKLIVDGEEQSKSLIKMIMDTQKSSNPNNTIKFSDNSSAIRGFENKALRPSTFDGPGSVMIENVNYDLIFTAETHNMPTAVAPFSGATTGTGGRLRDIQGIGRGGLPIAGTAGYCVGCLHIPGYNQSYENPEFKYPATFAKPLKILIDASNGASDYGNKFGEPVISGFVYSYGLHNDADERDEYVKPIMFSGGIGAMDATMRTKMDPKKGMLLAKIGGPVYRIGVGGGAASSVEVQGSNDADLDFNAVQRGDAEMENKLNRVVRACIEMGDRNPILAIHDQGAGGNGNVLKELVEPGFAGAIIFSKEFQLGDPTITALELWGAEYQENNAILCRPEYRKILENICTRERCPICFVGTVTGNGRVSLIESQFDNEFESKLENPSQLGPIPFDLELKHVLGEMPKREYKLDHRPKTLHSIKFEDSVNVADCLERVFSLVAVGSKRFLTNKVDRCVTGLIAQQQCIGPLHTPLSDFGLTAISYFGKEGIATSIGTQPIKGLLCPKSMARMCVAEALSNLVFVKITELGDVKCSGNWMWAAKLPGEGANLFDACKEMCLMMEEMSIAIDGGKDSLSMAAKVCGEVVKSPGTLVISTYAPCPDISLKITPALKGPAMGLSETSLIWINIEGKFRLGGSSLAQVLSQQGNECPTVLRTEVLRNAFNITQKFLAEGKLLAGHDISDGGLLTCLLEMSFAGLTGLFIDTTAMVLSLEDDAVDSAANAIERPELAVLFAEECGWVLEVKKEFLKEIQCAFTLAGVPNYNIGSAIGYGLDSKITVVSTIVLLNSNVRSLLKQWERTSFELEKLQANTDCVTEEFNSLEYRTGPVYSCPIDLSSELVLNNLRQICSVAVLREEGVNSDREMMACFIKANFEVHDVTMSDLLTRKTSLDRYRGVIFPGGFSYADTLGSAKGWAANIMFSDLLASQFSSFKNRKDTFSLGICNGCQLMSLIGWVGTDQYNNSSKHIIDIPNVALLHNKSERFECRWSTVRIEHSNSLMLKSLEGSILGCWVAHGEGRFSFATTEVLKNLNAKNCVPLRYVDDKGVPTDVYPMNPNGSLEGIAGLCSEDGRHLAIMPHPERCSAMFQWPYVSPNFKIKSEDSPWQVMFNNAYKWCTKNL